MPRYLAQKPPWVRSNKGDRIPHSDKVDYEDPDRAGILINLHRMELAGVEIDDRAVEIARALTRRHREEHEATRPPEPTITPDTDASGQPRWVYYVRCGYLIKIGTSANLATRFQAVRPNEILALEPGGQSLETTRHRQFRTLLAGGEYFHPGPALQAHILELRERLGPPNWHGSVLKDGHDYFTDNPG